MKNKWSIIAIGIVAVIFVIFRTSYPTEKSGKQLQLTEWDALGYYMYTPSIFIYQDVNHLEWMPEIDSTYQLSGGNFYQASKHENGNYVNKYLGGIAIMQLPFFAAAHVYASISGDPADGFSAPYQVAVACAALFYCFLGLLFLRLVLLRYFKDGVVALTILFMALGTNLLQYAAIEGGQSHIYIFPLYAFVLWFTLRWHETPHWKWAALIGFTIGLATICRPTELIMLFIPLLWNTHTKESKRAKWKLVRGNMKHVYVAVLFGLIGVLPQLIYWKYTSGTFIYDVGSKWFFFNPWFRVLFGVDNGFFVYTPIALLFIIGFFFMKKYAFQRSVLVFCLLNIWIIMAWSDWRYGATFSTRAMVQSYPVFALGLAALLACVLETRIWKWATVTFAVFMIGVNFFQITQYNALIINYRDMNWAYYGRIYLNPSPSPLDMSLLDNKDFIYDESDFKKKGSKSWSHIHIKETAPGKKVICSTEMPARKGIWVKVEARIKVAEGFSSNYLTATSQKNKRAKIRLHNAMTTQGEWNNYAFYMKVPDDRSTSLLSIAIEGHQPFEGEVAFLRLTYFQE